MKEFEYRNHRKLWTEEEIQYLEENWGNITEATICKTLGRSVRAIRVKAIRLGLGGYFDSTSYLSLRAFMGCFGIYPSNIHKSIVKIRAFQAGMPIVVKKMVNRQRIMVNVDKFWKWAEDHKDIFPWYKLEPLILGKEPEWVAEARHESYLKYHNSNKKWDWIEECNLCRYIKAGMSFENIALKMGRPVAGVKRKYTRLKKERKHGLG